MSVANKMQLFHGSYARVEQINLAKCQKGKDFGAGFYLTDNEAQAQKFIKTSLLKAKRFGLIEQLQDFGYVSTFSFEAQAADLNVVEFAEADGAWLDFVSLNRRGPLFDGLDTKLPEALFAADVIVGKIANDNTNKVINAYLNGLYGPVGQAHTKEIALSLLLPNRLKNQYCFLTDKAVSCLKFEGAARYDVRF
jgi:hypothetical protein